MNCARSILLSLIFIAFVLMPQLGLIFNIENEREKFQNRSLARLPEINMQTLLSASFGKEVNEYIWDHLPLRQNFLKADHYIDYHIFKDSPVLDQVLLGRDDWLFLYPAVMKWPQKNSRQVEKFTALARKADTIRTQTGKEIYILPSPSKASIYPEFLFDYHFKTYWQHADILQSSLEKAAAQTKSLMALWSAFHNEKERLLRERTNSMPSSARYLFRPRDRHFSWETAVLQAKNIINSLMPGQWDDKLYAPYFSPYQNSGSEMEKRFMKIDLPEPYQTFFKEKYLRALTITIENTPVAMTKGTRETFLVGNNRFTQPLPKKVVVIHDSFFDQSRFLLAPYFQETVYMHWRVSRNFPFLMNEIKSADIVIIQSVEDRWHVRYARLERILQELATSGQ